MKITRISAVPMAAKLDTTYSGGNFHFNTARLIAVKVETDVGVTGLATLHGHAGKAVCDMFHALQPLVAGMDALAHEVVWQKVFALSTTPPQREQGLVDRDLVGNDRRALLMRCIAGIDIALWDIKGKVQGLPVWRLLGGDRNRMPAYVTGGYYRWDRDNLRFGGELETYVKEGFSTVKIKVGALPLEQDVLRVAEARREIGPDCRLAVDGNCAYSVPQAIEAVQRFEPYGIAWFEEPVHWYDACRGLAAVAAATHVPISSGESEIHSWACRDLVDLGKVRIMQYEANRAGGVTDWLRVASYCHQHGVTMSTHHEPHIQCHLTAAVPNGGIAETFSRSARDPFWEELYTERAELRDGHIVLPDTPGFGFDIDWKVVEKYRI